MKYAQMITAEMWLKIITTSPEKCVGKSFLSFITVAPGRRIYGRIFTHLPLIKAYQMTPLQPDSSRWTVP
jgi:hypothetical protein